MPIFQTQPRYRALYGPPPISPGVLSPDDDDLLSGGYTPGTQSGPDNLLQQQSAPTPPPSPAPDAPKIPGTAGAASTPLPTMAEASGAGPVPPPLRKATGALPPNGPVPGQMDHSIATSNAGPQPPVDSSGAGMEETPDAQPPSTTDQLAAKRAEVRNLDAGVHNNFLQRLALAALSVTRLAPLANSIVHPAYTAQRGALERQVGDLAAQQQDEQTIGLNKAKIEAETTRANAYQSEQEANAAYKTGLNEEHSAAARQRSLAQEEKAMGPTARLAQPGEQPPAGWAVVKSAIDPSVTYVKRDPWIQLPNDPQILAAFPGRKAGDTVSTQEYDTANKQLGQININNLKPKKSEIPPTMFAPLKALGADPDNPSSIAPDVWKKAIELSKERPPTINVNAPPPLSTATLNALNNPPAPGQQNEQFLTALPPAERNIVKAISEYRMPLPSSFALTKPYWQDIMTKVAAYDPAFDATKYHARQNLRTDFTAGRTAQNVRSLNTLAGHLGSLEEAGNALHNGDNQTLNKIVNGISNEFGDPSITNFDIAKTAVATEMATALKGQATEGEIKAWAAAISRAQGPQQLRAAVSTPLHLMNTRLGAIGEQYTGTMGKLDVPLIYPHAQEVFSRHGIGAGAVDPKVQAYADHYFGGDVARAQAAIAQQRGGR